MTVTRDPSQTCARPASKGAKPAGTRSPVAALYRSRTLADAARYLGREVRAARTLREKATHDSLTGLMNKYGLKIALKRELQRCERGLATGGLIAVLELDNFKAVSGIHGITAANAGLRLLAGTLKTEIRAMDVAARTGTEEFALLLSNTTKKLAASRLQLLMWRLNRLELAWQGQYVPVRVSLALYEYERGNFTNIEKWRPDILEEKRNAVLSSSPRNVNKEPAFAE